MGKVPSKVGGAFKMGFVRIPYDSHYMPLGWISKRVELVNLLLFEK